MSTNNTPAPQVEMVSELQRLSELADSGVWSFEQIDDNEYGQTVYGVDTDEFTQELAEFYGDKSSVEFVCRLVNWFRENQAALNAWAGGDGWLPIESAPNRERVLVCGGDVYYVCIAESDPGRYQQAPVTDRQEWYQVGTRGSGRIWPHPTHWQPLPTPPAALASQAVGVGS